MDAAPSQLTHSFSDGTVITLHVSSLVEVTAETEPRRRRLLSLFYEVRDRDHPEWLYDSDQESFRLRRAGSEIYGTGDVAEWLDDGEWSVEGYEDFPSDFLDILVEMVIDAITAMWRVAYTILVTAVIDVRVEEPSIEAAVAALDNVFVMGGDSLCAICLEDFCIKMEALSMPCSHTFHRVCIGRWLSRRSTCPMCRFQLP